MLKMCWQILRGIVLSESENLITYPKGMIQYMSCVRVCCNAAEQCIKVTM